MFYTNSHSKKQSYGLPCSTYQWNHLTRYIQILILQNKNIILFINICYDKWILLARDVNGRQLYPKVTTKVKLISFRQRLKKSRILSVSYSINVSYTTYKDRICFISSLHEPLTYQPRLNFNRQTCVGPFFGWFGVVRPNLNQQQ